MDEPKLTYEQYLQLGKRIGCKIEWRLDEAGELRQYFGHATGFQWQGDGWRVFENCRNGVDGFVPFKEPELVH